MTQQSYNNHSRFVKGFHFILGGLLAIGAIASVVNVGMELYGHFDLFDPILIMVLFACGIFLFWFTRQFPIKAQDRAIRAEEHLRYFILTRNPMDKRVTMEQIIALRFAPDEEFIVLVDRAVNENLTANEIKKEIKNWRADNYRA
jgi:hypothetical protein